MSGEGDNENVIKLDYADILETTELSALRFWFFKLCLIHIT
jgi:hypothetical protein